MSIIQVIAIVGVITCNDHNVLYPISICLGFISRGSYTTLYGAVCSKVFGMAHGGVISTYTLFALPAGSICSYLLDIFFKTVVGDGAKDHRVYVLYVSLVLALANVGILMFFDDTEMKVTEDGKEIYTNNTIFHRFLGGNKVGQ
jgi:hypothetical protein